MNKAYYLKICSLCLAICFTSIAVAQSEEIKDGEKVQLEVKNQYVGTDSVMQWDMRLINKDGFERRRILTRHMKETGGLKKILSRFSSPADIRKTGLLTWENKGADDTQFLYLPAMKKVRRIASVDKEQSFVGTDFNYEDLGNLKVDDYTYSQTRTEVIDNEECYYYECNAKPGVNTVYSKMKTWTSKESFVRIRVEYFDKKKRLFKIGRAGFIEKIDGIWTPLYISMEDIQDGHKTEVFVSNVMYDSGLSDDLFGLINLENASLERF